MTRVFLVLFDRKTSGDKYTSFMGTDNIQLAKMLGHYIARSMGGKGVVVEIQGLKASSPSVDCHRGFIEAMNDYPDIKVITSSGGADWTAKTGEKAINEILSKYNGEITAVYGHNDRLAMGARNVLEAKDRKALNTSVLTRFLHQVAVWNWFRRVLWRLHASIPHVVFSL